MKEKPELNKIKTLFDDDKVIEKKCDSCEYKTTCLATSKENLKKHKNSIHN